MPNNLNPFPSDEVVDLFRQALVDADAIDMIPEGLLLSDGDWPEGYPTHESITTGTRSGKKLSVALPPEVWLSRAVLWGQGLAIMDQFLLELSL